MRKLLLLFLGIIFIPLTMYAGLAFPDLIKDKQTDGTVIEYYLRGDEKIHWMESPDGHTLLMDNNERIVYAILNSQGDLEPSTIVYSSTSLKRSADPQVSAIPKKLFYSASQINSMLDIWKIEKDQIKGRSLGTRPYQGEFRVLCVLVDFPDKPMITQDAKAKFEMLLNQRGYLGTLGNRAYGSVKDYFLENSYGKVDITFDVIGPYRADSIRNYKGGSAARLMNLSKLGKFLIDNKISQEPDLDLSLYADPSGEINRLHIFFAGEDQAAVGFVDGFAWAHQHGFGMGASLDPWNPVDYSCVSPKDGQTYHFKRYSCSSELIMNVRNKSEKHVTTIGTPTHELAHLLFGSDDFYDTSGVYKGTGVWDLMAAGSHSYITENYYTSIIYGSSPPHINMYEKMRLGWVKPQILNTQGIISLENSAENPVAYIYQKGSNLTSFTSVDDIEGDYFIIENKQKKGFDAGLLNEAEYNGPLFQGGLLVYRANKNLKSNSSTNSYYPQRLYPVCASSEYDFPGPIEGGNIVTSYGNINSISCVFGNAYNSFTDESTPSARTILEYGTGSNVTTSTETEKPLTNIVNQNGIVTFRFGALLDAKYHEDDKEGLRAFLKENKNLEACNLVPSDTLNWNMLEEWVDKFNTNSGIYVEWSNEVPKRLIGLNLKYMGDKITGYIRFAKFEKLESLDFSFGTTLASYNVTNCKNLKTLICSNNFYMSSLNVASCPNLEYLECSWGKIGNLDLSGCPKLKYLSCSINYLTDLDLSNCPDLEYLACGTNLMTKLNASVCPKLKYLECERFTHFANHEGSTKLTDLDVSACVELESLLCGNNDLTNLNIYAGNNLKSLSCANNRLTELDVSNYSKLNDLWCEGNQLTELDLADCSNLSHLSCQNNQLKSLNNIGDCINLLDLWCSNNQLSQLDVSASLNILQLDCSLNQLSELKVPQRLDWKELHCNNNYLKFSTLPVLFPSGSWYSYSPQQAIDGENTPSDQIIDLSSEYNINGNITNYEWRELTGTPVSVKSLGNGRFIAESYAGHHLECVMTNAIFPDLILYYRVLVTPGTETIELKDHLKVKLDNNHLVSKGQTFQIYANTNSTNLDGVYFGLYNPINGDLRDSLIVISRTNNVYTCQLRSQTPNSAYMLMPYIYKNGERIDIERPASSPLIDKLPIKVNEDIWGRSLTSYVPSEDVSANKYIQLNINNKVNELFAIDQFVPFKVYMPTTAPTAARIGLFYQNGTFYMDITASRSTYTYTCEITDEVQEGDYIIMPYIKEAGKVQVIERTPNSKLMDRLPVKVNAVDIWGDDIWSSPSFRTAPLNVEDGSDKVFVSLENLSDILTVKASFEIIKTEIYNIQGILMKKVDRESRFSVNNLSAGVYIVKVTTSKGITTHKIKKD